MERLAVIARLRPGSLERAKLLVAGGPPFDPGEAGFDSHTVFAGNDEVVFVFEGDAADELVRDLLDDRVRSASFSAWAPLLDGVPRIVHEVYQWRKTGR